MGVGFVGWLLFGIPLWVSVAVLAFPQECLRFLQVPRLGKYSWIPNKWYIEKDYHIHSKLINPYLTNLYFRHSQYSSFALHWQATWFVSSLYQSIGCFLLPVPMYGFNMCGIRVSLSYQISKVLCNFNYYFCTSLVVTSDRDGISCFFLVEKGICLPTVFLWLLFVYIEASIRLKEFKAHIDMRHLPFHLDLCRPFAAHW